MKKFFQHESALIEKGAKIGNNTKVWMNSQIRDGAIIGNDCIISKDTFVDERANFVNKVFFSPNQNAYNKLEKIIIYDLILYF